MIQRTLVLLCLFFVFFSLAFAQQPTSTPTRTPAIEEAEACPMPTASPSPSQERTRTVHKIRILQDGPCGWDSVKTDEGGLIFTPKNGLNLTVRTFGDTGVSIEFVTNEYSYQLSLVNNEVTESIITPKPDHLVPLGALLRDCLTSLPKKIQNRIWPMFGIGQPNKRKEVKKNGGSSP